ncbi:MAG TPA: ABC transporter permease [Thermoanaerobaculia bacterium]|jgi:predicted permease|nr:ABC transporter permease [Thermoanaerobaculia bacterium]
MTDLARTWRQAVRGLARTPALTFAAIASFALGIGANTLIFTFLNALFLSPLPVTDPARLIAIYSTDPENPGLLPISQPNAVDLREQVKAFSGLAAVRSTSVALLDGGEPEMVPAALVNGNYFSVLGLVPERGRFFQPEEDAAPGAGTAVVLSHALWQRRFGGAPGLVGKTIRINGLPLTVAGIAPADFAGLSLIDEPPQLWIPLSLSQQILSGPQARGLLRRNGRQLQLVARLQPTMTLDAARGALDAAARDLARIYPEENRGLGFAALPLAEATIPQALRGRLVKAGALLAAVVGLLLLVAGANVANLLLARALSRDRETAVRVALGARRGQLAALLLTEGLALALAGGAVGLLLASWGRALLWRLRPPFFPESLAPHLDARVLAFTFAVSLVTGLLFGLAPLAGSLRTDLAAALGNAAAAIGSGGYGGRRGPGSLRALLVGAQVALSAVVLVGAGLFVHSLIRAEQTDLGFERERLFGIPVDLGARGYAQEPAQEFYRNAVARVKAVPGVASAAVSSRFLLVPAGERIGLTPSDRPPAPGTEGVLIGVDRVGPRYFETVGLRLVAGRGFLDSDRLTTPQVAVVNRALARWLWPGENAIGRRFNFSGDPIPTEVVGITEDARLEGVSSPPEPVVWVPVAQAYSPVMIILARTEGDPAPIAALARREIQALDRVLPLLEARTIRQVAERSLWAPRMSAGLLAAFALLAALLAGIGIYGVATHAARQRDREIGLRMALGAQRGQVRALLLGAGFRPIAIGTAVGLAVAFAFARPFAPLLLGVSPFDPWSYGAAALALFALGLLSLLLPAWRAARAEPATALRAQ